MKTKEQAVAKAVCNEILASIGKLMAKGVEEPFVNGEQEIWKSGKQAGLYAAKKVVKEALDRALVGSGEGIVSKNPQTPPLSKEVDESDKTLYSERTGPPDKFIQAIRSKGFNRTSIGFYEFKKGDSKISVDFDFKTYSVVAVIQYDGYKFYTYARTFEDSNLEGFIKTIEEAESSIPKQ
jgi:hypothetical protein